MIVFFSNQQYISLLRKLAMEICDWSQLLSWRLDQIKGVMCARVCVYEASWSWIWSPWRRLCFSTAGWAAGRERQDKADAESLLYSARESALRHQTDQSWIHPSQWVGQRRIWLVEYWLVSTSAVESSSASFFFLLDQSQPSMIVCIDTAHRAPYVHSRHPSQGLVALQGLLESTLLRVGQLV